MLSPGRRRIFVSLIAIVSFNVAGTGCKSVKTGIEKLTQKVSSAGAPESKDAEVALSHSALMGGVLYVATPYTMLPQKYPIPSYLDRVVTDVEVFHGNNAEGSILTFGFTFRPGVKENVERGAKSGAESFLKEVGKNVGEMHKSDVTVADARGVEYRAEGTSASTGQAFVFRGISFFYRNKYFQVFAVHSKNGKFDDGVWKRVKESIGTKAIASVEAKSTEEKAAPVGTGDTSLPGGMQRRRIGGGKEGK